MSIYNGIINFISTLTTFDIIFFCALILLIILVIIMLYIVDQNEEGQFKMIESPPETSPPVINQEVSPITNQLSPFDDNLDLTEVTKALKESEPINIDMNKYEIEQEERAIISYDELLENTGSFKINYEDEQEKDGVSVKKVDLTNIATINPEEPLEDNKVQVMSYAKEEAFLNALKQLQQLLN